MKKTIYFGAIFLLATSCIFAHPHLFMSSAVEVVWEKETLKGAWIEWEFDAFFSNDIIYAYDADRDGKFNEKEIKDVYNNAFINLKHYYYFLFIRQGEKRWNPKEVYSFTAGIRAGNTMWYRFFIDLSSAEPNEINLAVYDYTFFCDIRPVDKNPVRLSYDPMYVKPKWTIVENKNYPVYYDPLGSADDFTIYYEWKKGLQTYYPKEIRISYGS